MMKCFMVLAGRNEVDQHALPTAGSIVFTCICGTGVLHVVSSFDGVWWSHIEQFYML